MDVLYLLIPLSVVIILVVIVIFWWALESGQFDNIVVDPAGHRSGELTGSGAAYDDTWYWRCD